MNLTNFQEVFQSVENKTVFDNNYTAQNTHGSYLTTDQELLTPQFINELDYSTFEDQRQFQIAQIWRGKSNTQTATLKDEYYQFTPTQTQWEKYYKLYIQSLKSLADIKHDHTRLSLFHQQLSYSIPKNKCYLTIDTDVYIPKSSLSDPNLAFKEDDKLLIQFMERLRDIIAKYVRIPMIDQSYQLDPSHKLFDYIITCRAKTDNTVNPEHQSKNDEYVRYGYHTYFYNLVMSQETKIMLYNLIINDLQKDTQEFSILNQLKQRYQETFQLGEYLDRGPFIATSSLPFTSGSLSSIYLYIIDPTDQVRITATSRQERFKELFMCLNPFRGFGIPIKTEYEESQNIIRFTKNELNCCHNYFTGIRFVNSHILNNIIHKDIVSWFYSNIVLKLSHLYWNEHREVFIHNTYTLLNKDLFLTELFYFISMCEDPEGIIKQEDERYKQEKENGKEIVDNFQSNRERDRYPIKCHIEVQRVLKDRLNGINQSQTVSEEEQEKALSTLIDWYNQIMDSRIKNSTNEVRPLAPMIHENPYSLYQKFSNFLQKAWNGCLASTPFENLNIEYIKSQFDIYLYQTVFKNTRCISEQGKNIQTHDDTLYEYMPLNQGETKKIRPYEPTPEQGHYQILKTSKFISIMSSCYDKLINDYALIVNSSARFTELQTEDVDGVQQTEKANSKINKQKRIIQVLTTYKVKLSENSCKQLIPALSKAHGFETTAQPNNTRLLLGVYNGILKYDPEKKNFFMLTNEECMQQFQTQTTLFKVNTPFINKEGLLISREEFLNSDLQEFIPYKQAYEKITKIFTDIFGESQISVLKWKISTILFQILTKTPNQHILIEYGTGGDGKSMNNEAIQYVLGLSSNNQQVTYQEESRKIQNIGYSTIAKSSVLITSEISSSQHDSGGLSELEQSYFASFAELTSNQPLSSSAVKRLAGGTSITCRKAHSPIATSFVNKAFIVLQTNNYPRFDQTLEDGAVRRMLFYKYPHKFLDLNDFNKAKDKTNVRLKDFSLQSIFQENIYMVDMFGVYMLWCFLESQEDAKITTHTPIARPRVPQIIIEQSRQFFSTYDKECNSFLQDYLNVQNLQQTNMSLDSSVLTDDRLCLVPQDDQQPQEPQTIHYMKYQSLSTLIDTYCNDHQLKFNKSIISDNITYYINKTYMSRISVYEKFERKNGFKYKKLNFDINAFENYTRTSNTYVIIYEGFYPKKGASLDASGITDDDKLKMSIDQNLIYKKV